MDNITIAFVGYISGALAGGFFALIILIAAYLYSTDQKVEDIEPIHIIYEFLNVYYEESTMVFSISFVLGFLSGVGVFASKSS